jgi:hypothetical protein
LLLPITLLLLTKLRWRFILTDDNNREQKGASYHVNATPTGDKQTVALQRETMCTSSERNNVFIFVEKKHGAVF